MANFFIAYLVQKHFFREIDMYILTDEFSKQISFTKNFMMLISMSLKLNYIFYFPGRALAWLICLMHMIEIIFKDLFFAIDGKPSGPDSYTGDIGKKHALKV